MALARFRSNFVAAILWFAALIICSGVSALGQEVFTVAGGGVNDNGAATSASLAGASFAARDAQGNLFIADRRNHRIRKVGPDGIITTVSGNGIAGFSGDGGMARHAMVNLPTGILIDSAGNLLFSDQGNSRIRKIDVNGIISTVAGDGVRGYGGDGGPALAASFRDPAGIAVDLVGNLYIADSNNDRVRVVDAAGVIRTAAGTGVAGYNGDGIPAKTAQLYNPQAVAVGNDGSLYITDWSNNRVRHVDRSGTIATFAGNGTPNCGGDGGLATQASVGRPEGLLFRGGALLISTGSCGQVRSVELANNIISTVAGSSSGYDGDGHAPLLSQFRSPYAMLTDGAGNLLVIDRSNERIRSVNIAGQQVTTVVGGFIGDGGLAVAASLNNPYQIAFDPNKNLYIVDSGYNRVRKVSADGTITTFAGTGISGYSGDGGPANLATMTNPYAVAADELGNVFIADQYGSTLRKVDVSGQITTIASGLISSISSLAVDREGNIYGADQYCDVWRVNPNGVASLFAGKFLKCGFAGDGGPADQSLLHFPSGVAVDARGDVFIADSGNDRVRMVERQTGIITTVAGNGTCGFSGDEGPAIAASLCFPIDVAIGTNGNWYIADSVNLRIRSVDGSGTIHTFAGTGTAGYNGNGLPAMQTNIDWPNSLAATSSGQLFFVDLVQNRVKKIQ